jgi:hypothetical protein
MTLSIKKKELQELLQLLNGYGTSLVLAGLYEKASALAKKNKIIVSDDASSSDEDQSGDLFPDSSSS